jgi:hypothetical protein
MKHRLRERTLTALRSRLFAKVHPDSRAEVNS